MNGQDVTESLGSTPPSQGARLVAGTRVGDFELESYVGSGGMGIVYRARQISLKRTVALKILGNALTRSSDIVRFQREAQAAARLKPPEHCKHFLRRAG